MSLPEVRSTTVLAVIKDGRVAMGGDGQVTMGDAVVKGSARKVRALKDGRILAGFEMRGLHTEHANGPVGLQVDPGRDPVADVTRAMRTAFCRSLSVLSHRSALSSPAM